MAELLIAKLLNDVVYFKTCPAVPTHFTGMAFKDGPSAWKAKVLRSSGMKPLPGAGGERAMVAAAARQGVRLRGLSEYYLARPELCRADTVVAGYSALKEDDVEKVAQALARAWLS